jgi:hypothetical protein
MAVHAVWASVVLARRDERLIRTFHRSQPEEGEVPRSQAPLSTLAPDADGVERECERDDQCC